LNFDLSVHLGDKRKYGVENFSNDVPSLSNTEPEDTVEGSEIANSHSDLDLGPGNLSSHQHQSSF